MRRWWNAKSSDTPVAPLAKTWSISIKKAYQQMQHAFQYLLNWKSTPSYCIITQKGRRYCKPICKFSPKLQSILAFLSERAILKDEKMILWFLTPLIPALSARASRTKKLFCPKMERMMQKITSSLNENVSAYRMDTYIRLILYPSSENTRSKKRATEKATEQMLGRQLPIYHAMMRLAL